MKHPFKKEDAPQGRSTKTVKVLGAEEFLYKSKGGYYEKPTEFQAWGESLRPADAHEVGKLFRFMKERYKCIKESEPKFDRGNKKYKWYTFQRSGTAQPGVKVILDGPMEAIMDDYQDDVLEITFTLEDLLAYIQTA